VDRLERPGSTRQEEKVCLLTAHHMSSARLVWSRAPASVLRKSANFVLCAGLAACLAGAGSLASAATASATPAPNSDQGTAGAAGWAGGYGWGGPRSRHGHGATTGTVVSAPAATAPTTFTMDVAGAGSTTTLVTVNVATTTKTDDRTERLGRLSQRPVRCTLRASSPVPSTSTTRTEGGAVEFR
jgi:hypothetical protein